MPYAHPDDDPLAAQALLPPRRRAPLGPIVILALQVIAALYFVIDGVDDLLLEAQSGISLEVVMECLVAFALLGGVVLGARYVQALRLEMQWKDAALARAKGAMADHMRLQFRTWQLTPGEAEVALFALKGCDVAEIARLRQSAPGTVRAQLSQIYAKAGVTSQAMLVSLFLDDLLEMPMAAAA